MPLFAARKGIRRSEPIKRALETQWMAVGITAQFFPRGRAALRHGMGRTYRPRFRISCRPCAGNAGGTPVPPSHKPTPTHIPYLVYRRTKFSGKPNVSFPRRKDCTIPVQFGALAPLVIRVLGTGKPSIRHQKEPECQTERHISTATIFWLVRGGSCLGLETPNCPNRRC